MNNSSTSFNALCGLYSINFLKNQELRKSSLTGPNDIFVEKEGKFTAIDIKINQKSIDEFIYDVGTFNRKEISETNPTFNGSLPDGSRINITTKPIRLEGPAITIRRFLKSIQTFDSRQGIFGLSNDWVQFMKRPQLKHD